MTDKKPSRLVSSDVSVVSVATSAFLWFFLLRLGGVTAAVVGVYVLYGTGWALIAVGVCSIAASEFIRKGLISRG